MLVLIKHVPLDLAHQIPACTNPPFSLNLFSCLFINDIDLWITMFFSDLTVL